MDASFSKHIASRAQASAEKLNKGERTKRRLKATVAGLLETQPLRTIRIADICSGAGLSQGTFYLYFKDKEDIVTAVLRDFDEFTRKLLLAHGRGHSDPYEAIRSTTKIYVAVFKANAGLMTLLLISNQEIEAGRDILLGQTQEWAARMEKSLLKRSSSPLIQHTARFTSYAVGAMVDQTLAYLYIHRDPNMLALVESEANLVDMLSILQYRAVYASDPPSTAS